MTDAEYEAFMRHVDAVMRHANRAIAEGYAALARAEKFMADTLIAETEEFLREQA